MVEATCMSVLATTARATTKEMEIEIEKQELLNFIKRKIM